MKILNNCFYNFFKSNKEVTDGDSSQKTKKQMVLNTEEYGPTVEKYDTSYDGNFKNGKIDYAARENNNKLIKKFERHVINTFSNSSSNVLDLSDFDPVIVFNKTPTLFLIFSNDKQYPAKINRIILPDNYPKCSVSPNYHFLLGTHRGLFKDVTMSDKKEYLNFLGHEKALE